MKKRNQHLHMQHSSPILLKDPELSYPDKDNTLSFNNYIDACKTLIKNNRLAASSTPWIVDANAPFELRPGGSAKEGILPQNTKIKYGALLIHGLFDSPFTLKDIGHVLQSQGVLVRAVLLPGHGTVPGGLLHVTYEDWMQTVRYGISSFADDVEKIILVGFSTGAALALHQLMQDKKNIAGIISFSPAIKIKTIFAPLSGWLSKMGRYSKRIAWASICTENDYTKYQSVPFNAVYQVYKLTRIVRKQLKKSKLPCPSLTFISKDDKTVCSSTALKFFNKINSKPYKIVFYAKKPNTNMNTNVISRPSFYPKKNIINFSHVALPIAPTNPHYGAIGDYKKNNSGCIYGSFTPIDLSYYHFLKMVFRIKQERAILTFNPDFGFLIQQIRDFIAACD